MRTGKRSGSFAGGGTTCDRPQRSSIMPTEAANCLGRGGRKRREWLTACVQKLGREESKF